ncbi:hypothetical protein FRB95_010382 [Tulasnella sp. JGI-2019a]|nr:hypothetical protein FRB95_010382 [Tulasnella sp. JGI-2019a]
MDLDLDKLEHKSRRVMREYDFDVGALDWPTEDRSFITPSSMTEQVAPSSQNELERLKPLFLGRRRLLSHEQKDTIWYLSTLHNPRIAPKVIAKELGVGDSIVRRVVSGRKKAAIKAAHEESAAIVTNTGPKVHRKDGRPYNYQNLSDSQYQYPEIERSRRVLDEKEPAARTTRERLKLALSPQEREWLTLSEARSEKRLTDAQKNVIWLFHRKSDPQLSCGVIAELCKVSKGTIGRVVAEKMAVISKPGFQSES